MEKWYKIDNAGKLFPAVTDEQCTSTYRISIMLTESIQPEILQQAVDIVLKRFPTMIVKINKGVFWDFFSENKERILIMPEQEYPCSPIHAEQNNGHMLRIFYYRKKITVEAFHALTDSTGIMEFVKTLTYQYLILLGKTINDEGLILLPNGIPTSLETEDSFTKYCQSGKALREKQPAAFHIPGDQIIPNGNNVIHGTLSASALRDIAKQNGVTITAYLTAIYVYAIYLQSLRYSPEKAVITICVPINLRNVFPSKTLRNFFAVMNVNIQTSLDKTFEDIVCEVSEQIKAKSTKEYLYGEILANIKFEKIIALRLVPRFIKKIATKYIHSALGETKTTSTMSNLGRIAIPKDMAEFVENISATLYPTDGNPINCAVCTVGDCLTITFSRKILQGNIIEEFFRLLAGHCGLEVKVFSNDWGVRT